MPNNWEELQETGKTLVKGTPEKISDVQRTVKGSDWANKIEKLRSLAKRKELRKLIGGIPMVGGVASALSSGRAEAAVPVLGDVGDMGQPQEGTVDSLIQNPDRPKEVTDILGNPETSDEEKDQALRKYMKIREKLGK